ncbi:MAG: C25 family cysteine peptidase [Candidatus Krumholzibacteria bacterium]|nr:C25 family cysteine peptidase [Candidatus Krumholzibacteria bacterium]
MNTANPTLFRSLSMSGSFFAPAIAIVLLAAVIILSAASVPAYAAGTKLLSSDGSTITFEISVPAAGILNAPQGGVRVLLDGYGSFSPEGAFEVPGRTFLVAIPAWGSARIEANVVEADALGELTLARVMGRRLVRGEDEMAATEYFAPQGDPWEGRIMAGLAEAGEPSMMGRQRVLPIRINPLIAGEGGYSLARRISVTVRLDSPEKIGFSTDETPIPVSRAWKKIYDGILVNPADAERFVTPAKGRSFTVSPAAPGKRLKLKIPETGVYSIRADSLISKGLSPALSNTGFALKKLYYDEGEGDLTRESAIPMKVIKGTSSTPGIFSGDDRVVFFAEGIKDDEAAGDVFATFTDYNVIWLEEDLPGSLMREAALPPGPGEAASGFNAVYRGRKDAWYHKNINAGTWDFYFVMGPVSEAVIPFTLNSPAPAGTFSLAVRVMGAASTISSQRITVSVRNGSGTHLLGSGTVTSTNSAVLSFSGLQSSLLADGQNELVLSSTVAYGFLVNDFEIRYSAGFSARDNMLEFTLPVMLPPQRVVIPGFTTDQGFIIDITDPSDPVFHQLAAGNFQLEGSTYKLTVDLSTPAESRFAALGKEAGRHVYNDWITVDSNSSLIGSQGAWDAVVIAHPDFLPPAMNVLTEYEAWREQQGYRVMTVDVTDVYDEFNGGLKSCDAIRRFIRYGAENWGTDYVLLVGDGNEDHKRIFYDASLLKGSPPDFIPPFTFSVDVVGTTYEDEVIASDKYYSHLDEEWPSEGYPDVFIGRFPVGRDVELQALLTKLYRFETPGAGDAWRKHIALFADDAWSGYPDYRYFSSELQFEGGMEKAALDIEESLPGGFDIERLFLSRWNDDIHEIGESGVQVFSEATDSTRAYFTPYLIDRLNEGVLFFSFQGHAHRAHLSSESGFSMFSQYRDLNRLTTDRNFIFMGAGCHISQFALVSELGRLTDGPNGDCISEQMLFKSRSGAIGAYASTGFEILDQNEKLFETLHQSIFQRPPSDSIPPAMEGTGAHWVAGGMITKAEIEHVGTTYYGFEQLYRYLFLGDPMTRIDPGPPRMALEADWGSGWEPVEAGALRSRSRTNECRLRFSASDVVALGGLRFEVDGDDRTGEMAVERLGTDTGTYPRGWSGELDYTLTLEDESLLFSVLTPEGRLSGSLAFSMGIGIRMFQEGGSEILPGGDCPAEGEFRLEVVIPVRLDEAPVLELDGIEFAAAALSIPDPQDSTAWQAIFNADFPGGEHVFTVRTGEYSADFIFQVGGSELVADSYLLPNPFSGGTNLCFTLNLPADRGEILIYNVSGRLIRSIRVPADMLDAANYSAPNVVYWDGRDLAGDRVANGTYIVLLTIEKDGREKRLTGMSVKLE